MYSKAEVTQLRQAFWTALGQYMAPVPSAEGDTTNWINYKTGVKHVYFRMQADNRRASIAIELLHPDAGIRELFWEQFRELRPLLHETLGETWTWEADATDANGLPLSRIYTELAPANLFSRDDWPALISFFPPVLNAPADPVFFSVFRPAWRPVVPPWRRGLRERARGDRARGSHGASRSRGCCHWPRRADLELLPLGG